MVKVVLIRYSTGPEGTQGLLVTSEGFSCHTLEPQDLNNERGISCIPEGEYLVVPRHSAKYGQHFHITSVPNRDWILEHKGNLAGRVAAGLKTHTNGCILVGMERGRLSGQCAVLRSTEAMQKLREAFNDQQHGLIIRKVYR